MQTIATTVKGYSIQEEIGGGGMGRVYRAYQSTIGREVAIKIIKPEFASRPDFIRRFETEAQTIARLEHPYIVPLFDYWRDPDGAYLVMRLLRGGSLGDALRRGPFDLEAAADVLDQICAALAVAHRNNVVHRDIKPANILLDEDGNAYLTDFGIAKDLEVQAEGVTGADGVVGSPDYLAPEQARNDPVAAQTDIYSLGVVLYEMLTGQHPFPGLSPVERLFRHLNDPLPEIASLDQEVSGPVNDVIQRATAKNPARRYPDALALASAFREAAALSISRVEHNLVELLTPREQEVLRLLMVGKSNREIADRLTVELATVKWYVYQLYRKLNVRSRVQAIVKARDLNLIVEDFARGETAATGLILPEPVNPYKGLRAFTAADEQDFFGRERLVGRLLKRLGENDKLARFLTVVGPSGSGKSSLVRAGLIPALWRGQLQGSDKWFVAEMMPGSHPLDELEVALVRVAAQHTENLREQLERDERGLLRVAQLILPEDDSELLIVIDQFEEMFTLVEDEERRAAFLRLLYAAVTEPRSRVRVVITLRADFYDRPLHYPDFGELIQQRTETVLPLGAEELERAILKPAERVGVRFEEGLVASIVSDVNYQPGALPLLQYALTELFESREDHTLTHAGYQKVGGAGGALAARAEELFAELGEAGQGEARQMFMRLVTLGEGIEDTRRRVPRAELLAISGDSDLMDEIIDTYASYRLLALDHDPATRRPTVEVAHEALLREWQRLRGWLDDSRADIRLQRQLAQAASEWREAGQDASFLLRGARLEQFEGWSQSTELALTPHERDFLQASLAQRDAEQAAEAERQTRETRLELRARNVLRVLVGVFAVAAIVAGGLALWANRQQRIALAERDNARSLALASAAQAALARGDTETALSMAVEANYIPDAPGFAQSILFDAALAYRGIRFFKSPGSRAHALSDEGRWLASAQADGTIIVWEVEKGQEIYRMTLDDLSVSLEGADLQPLLVPTHIYLAASPDGRYLLGSFIFSPPSAEAAESSPSSECVVIDVQAREIAHRLVSTGQSPMLWQACVQFVGDGRIFVRGINLEANARWLGLWDPLTDQITAFESPPNDGQTVALSPGGQTVLIWRQYPQSTVLTLSLWNPHTALSEFNIPGYVGRPDYLTTRPADFSPDGRKLAFVDVDAETGQELVKVWDVAKQELVAEFLAGRETLTYAVAFDAAGESLFVADEVGNVTQFTLSGEALQAFRHANTVIDLSVSADGRWLVTSGLDGVRVWTLADPVLGEVIVRAEEIDFTYSSADGQIVGYGTGTRDHQLFHVLVNEAGGYVERTAYEFSWESFFFSYLSRDGQQSITHNMEGIITVRDNLTGTSQFTWSAAGAVDAGLDPTRQLLWYLDTGEASQLSISPEGTETITLVDVALGEVVHSITADLTDLLGGGYAIAFSQDGRRMAVGDKYGEITIWDTQSWQTLVSLSEHTDVVESIALNSDGTLMASQSWDGTLRLWDTDRGVQLYALDYNQRTLVLSFSSDDRYLFGQNVDESLYVLDLETGEFVRQGRFEPAGFGFGDITSDNYLIYNDLDKVVRLPLYLGEGELLAWVEANRYVRPLTCEQRRTYRVEPLCDDTNRLPDAPTPTAVPEQAPASSPIGPVTQPQMTLIPLEPTATPSLGPAATPPRFDADIDLLAALGEGTPFLEDLAREEYSEEELAAFEDGQVFAYTISAKSSTEAIWGYVWCTTSSELLEQNWSHIQLRFVVNGIEIPLADFGVVDLPSEDFECQIYYALLSEWPVGEHTLRVEVTFDAPVNDGVADYPAGMHIFEYHVFVFE